MSVTCLYSEVLKIAGSSVKGEVEVDMVRWYVVKMFDGQMFDARTLVRKRLDVRKRKGV
jgi:hypothetical protein